MVKLRNPVAPDQDFMQYKHFFCFERGLGALVNGLKISQSTWNLKLDDGQIVSLLIHISVGPTTLSARINAFDRGSFRWNFIHDLFVDDIDSKDLLLLSPEAFTLMKITPKEIQDDEKKLLDYTDKLFSGKII